MRPHVWLLLLAFAGTLADSFGQTILGGELNIVGGPGLNSNGVPGPFFLDFDVSQPCPIGTTGRQGRALLCGNNGQVVLSVNGMEAFSLQPGGPSGPQGPPGQPATIAVGTVTTLPSGSMATVMNSGSPINAVLDFGIPEGPVAPGGASGSVMSADFAVVTYGPSAETPNTWLLPGAVTELFGKTVRVQADLTGAGCARLYTQIGENYGPIGAVMYFQYSADGGLTWERLTQDAEISTKGAHVSAWRTLPNAAKRDVLARAVADNGTNTHVDIEAVHLQVGVCGGTSLPVQNKLRRTLGRPRALTPRVVEHGRTLQQISR